MIHESFWWKNELYKCYKDIAKFLHLKQYREISYAKVEKALMIGAYIIRKLDDAEKIPPDFLRSSTTAVCFNRKAALVDHMNWHRVDRNYNVDEPQSETREWIYFINQIIHSFTYFCMFDEQTHFLGFIINSDKSKKANLFFLSVKQLLHLFLKISEGKIGEAHYSREEINKNQSQSEPEAMKLISAEYDYPKGFDLEVSIRQTLKGIIYKRKKHW